MDSELQPQLPYLPVYNAHFFPVKLTSKFVVRIIHGSHCLATFSLTYHKQSPCSEWFLITTQKYRIYPCISRSRV